MVGRKSSVPSEMKAQWDFGVGLLFGGFVGVEVTWTVSFAIRKNVGMTTLLIPSALCGCT